ncbi:neuropeptide SIFamide-like [Galleria mellonella]|uniref:Neuropeptide SIFamide-like n=1 Tax=Galleria mellonella TaxID=7137 RepID=A0ABM3N116_GALME|nr:neuropeptide SIFamide-like [Galleria mellonella]
MRSLIVFGLVAVFLCLLHTIEANYKKPPFNGSIFGKRNNIEYDSTGKALSALCEIASETCQAWYQALDNK